MKQNIAALLLGASALFLAGLLHAQTTKTPRIGVLVFDPITEAVKDQFRAGLRDHGYVEGKTIFVEWRSAEGRTDRADVLAVELVGLKVDLIMATPTPAVVAAKKATRTIPIVMAPAGDPLGTGFVASIARPGGNITGVTTMAAELGGKLLGTLQQLRPGLSRVAVLIDKNPFGKPFSQQVHAAGAKVGVHVLSVLVDSPANLEETFADMAKDRIEAVILQPQLATKHAAALALKHRLPSITTGIGQAYPHDGGLMYYGASGADSHRRAAIYVDKILRGEKPADMPVELPTKIELVLNLTTAKAIGISVPQPLVMRADQLIQ